MPEYYYVRQQAGHCATRIAHSVQFVDVTAQTFCHVFRAVKMAAAKAAIHRHHDGSRYPPQIKSENLS
jgi:hypothetical protein